MGEDNKMLGYFLIIKDKLDEAKQCREEALEKLENLHNLIQEMKRMVGGSDERVDKQDS